MQKNYFHDFKSSNENTDKKKTSQASKVYTQDVVDVNILLNRIKIEKKNEIKKKIIFFSCSTLALGLFATLIAIIR
mgnify:CR=1 FL=1|jgi:hypothetical protein